MNPRSSRFLAAVLSLVVALSPGAGYAAPPARNDQEVLATVEGIPITRLQWDRLAGPYYQEVEARAGRKLTDDERTLLRKNVLDELVRERLWVADAKRRGFAATEAEVDTRLQKNPYFQTNGKFDPAKFRGYKFSADSNYREIIEQVRDAVLLDKYVAWMRTRYAISEAALKKEFQSRTAQASLRYLWLTPETVSLEPQGTGAQIEAYYRAHPDEFQSPEEARLSYIRIGVEHAPGASDSVHAAAEDQARLSTQAVLAALRAGQPAERVAKEFGGIRDTGLFRVGDPIRGLGRSDPLTAFIRSGRLRQWATEPARIGPYYVIARVEEHRDPSVRPFRDAVGLVKRRVDVQAREALLDSLGRLDYAARPDRYRVAQLRAVLLARAVGSFSDPRPVSDRDVQKALARLRKSAGLPDTARSWADSLMKTLPDLVRRERQLDLAFRTMGEAAAALRKGETPEAAARRAGAVQETVSIYRGQPPAIPSLLEGALLDSLYKTSAGAVAGPRLSRDSVFVARVTGLDDRFLPPYEAVRALARSEAEARRQEETAREAEAWFATRRDRYRTPRRWDLDYVFFAKPKPEAVPVSEDSIRAYYERNPLEFTEPEHARVRHILISYHAGDPPGARTAARDKAAAALKRAQAGEDFGALAKELSDDRGSAAQGGDLGEIYRSQVVKEFADQAFRLKPGELSPVVETQYGFHVIRLESLTPKRLRPLDDCRTEIHTVIGETLADSLVESEARAFAAAAEKPGARFEELAKKQGGMKTSGPVGVREPVPGLGALPGMEAGVGAVAEGGITEPITVEGGLIVARVTRALAPRPAEFGEVKDQVIQDMLAERRRALADSLASGVQRDLKAGRDLESLAVPLGGLRLSRAFPRRGPVPEFARDSILGQDSTFYDEIFASKPGTRLKPRAGATGMVFAVVDSVTALNQAQYAEHKAALREELFEQRTAAWTERLRARADIRLISKELRN